MLTSVGVGFLLGYEAIGVWRYLPKRRREIVHAIFLFVINTITFLLTLENPKAIMKKKSLFSLLTLMMVVTQIVTFMACSEDDDVTPEISVPSGKDDYFAKSMDFEPSAAEKTITFNTNVAWTLSVADTRSGSSWLIVNPTSGEAGTHTITVKASENITYDDRNAVITIAAGDTIRKVFVNQKQLDALTLTSNRFEVPAGGGMINIEIKTNIKCEAIIPDAYMGWIHPSNEKTRGISTSSLSFIIDKSEEYNKREGQIIIKGKDKEETVTIYQVGEGILTLTSNEYNLNSSAQELMIEINSNFDYTVELPNVDWLKEITAQTRGVSTHTLILNVAENESYDNRSATIRVYDKNSTLSEEVVVNQSQKNTLIIDKKEYEFDENGGTFNVDINSNVTYTVSINCDWITETTSATRGLSSSNHFFTVNAITTNNDREGIITFSDAKTGVTEEVVVKQNRKIFFDSNTLAIMEGSEKKINITNKTTQSINWSSSNTSVVSVDNTGIVKGLSKGNAIITASTEDGKHSCKCEISVRDITDYVKARNLGGSIMSINGLIRYGSVLNWQFSNNSSEKVHLKTMQLIDGETGNAGNQMSVDVDVAANTSVSYSTTIGLVGIHAPVTCRFRFDFNEKEYYVDAVYSSNW